MKYFTENAPEWLATEKVNGENIEFSPLGVVAVISPWNYPTYVSLNCIVPALLAGNTVVYKPSEYAASTGIFLASLFQELNNFPEDALQLVVGAKEHGKELVKQDVQMVSLVGSTAAGKHVMEQCAKDLKKVLLELGGMDAAIVLSDVDIPKAAETIVKRNCDNTGQICCAIKRVYVEEEIYDKFITAAVEASKNISYGSPDQDVHMGPLVAKFQRDKIESIVADAKEKGANILTGGKAPAQKGYYYPSTVVTNVKSDMRIMTEEPFGPLLPIIPVKNWEEGVTEANNSNYGLTGSVWTKDLAKGRKIASKLDVGIAAVNAHGGGGFGLPWGGAKQSGIGRNGWKGGMREFTNIKTVHVHEA
ncbi:MAG: aldehyde dehydrogenase family protein [Bdellovibrionota bacterium]